MPSHAEPSVRRITHPSPPEFDRIIYVLRAAFHGDMQIAAVTNGTPEREPAFFGAQVETALADGELHVAGFDGRIDAVLLLYGPGQDFARDDPQSWGPPSNAYVNGLSPEMQQWWIHHLRPKYDELIHVALGSAAVRRAAWYVRFVGVHPVYQRRGLARALLEPVRAKADARRLCMCLEVQNDHLVRIFARFGFKVRGTKNFSSHQGGFPLFSMLREPPDA